MGHLKGLHNYQYKGSDFWLKVKRCYFAVDMGLGKTAMALETLEELKEMNLKTLIIAPLTPMATTWPEEIEKWKSSLTYQILYGPGRNKKLKAKSDLFITNFNSIPWLYNQLVAIANRKGKMPFSVCVIDEGSMIKSHSTKRFQYLDALKVLFPKYRALLSGTPSPNNYLDLWAQYCWLTDGKALGESYRAFRRTYFVKDEYKKFTYYIRDDRAKEEIFKKIAPYTYRLDEKDYLELPELVYNDIYIDMPADLRKLYNEFAREFVLTLKEVDVVAISAASLKMKLRQFTQGFVYSYSDSLFDKKGNPIRITTRIHDCKVKKLESMIEETNQPLLCAIQFKEDLQIIKETFPGVKYIVGGVSMETKLDHIKEWNKGNIPLLVCHPASISHGTNLQAGGANILWYAPTWNLEHYLQFNKRLHRQGQKQGVVVNHLMMKRSVDEQVFNGVARKKLNQDELLDYLRDGIMSYLREEGVDI